MYDLLIISLSISYILYVINHTEVIEEYVSLISRLTKSNFLFYVDYKEFINPRINPYHLNLITYKEYIILKYNNLFTRILFCPYCLSFWLSLIFCSLSGIFLYTLVSGFVSSLFYHVLLEYNKRNKENKC